MNELSMFGCVYQQSPVPCKSKLRIKSVMRRNTMFGEIGGEDVEWREVPTWWCTG